jgi:hypothetical protein
MQSTSCTSMALITWGGEPVLASKLETLIDAQALQSQDSEDRYSTDGVSWQQHEVLLARLGDSPGFRDVELLAACVRHPNPLIAAQEFRQRL